MSEEGPYDLTIPQREEIAHKATASIRKIWRDNRFRGSPPVLTVGMVSAVIDAIETVRATRSTGDE